MHIVGSSELKLGFHCHYNTKPLSLRGSQQLCFQRRVRIMGYMTRLVPFLIALELARWGSPGDGDGHKLKLEDIYGKPRRHFIEMFAGDRSVTKGLWLLGYQGEPVDLRIQKTHDLMTPFGFLASIALIWGIAKGGLCWMAPPCSSWVWMSRHSTGRSKDDAKGNEKHTKVWCSNILVSRLCYLIALCWRRGVHFIIEQPSSSVMFEFSRLKKLLTAIGDDIHWAYSELGAWTLEMQKGLVLCGTAPWLEQLGRKMTAYERSLMKDGHQKKSAYHWDEWMKDGHPKKRSRGAPDLKPSQSYPMGFGCWHALKFTEHVPQFDPATRPCGDMCLDEDSESDSSIDSEDPALRDLLVDHVEFFAGSFSRASSSLREAAVPLA